MDKAIANLLRGRARLALGDDSANGATVPRRHTMAAVATQWTLGDVVEIAHFWRRRCCLTACYDRHLGS